LSEHANRVPAGSKLAEHLGKSAYSLRLLRYWWAGQALAEEARALGRPLTVVDLGCERGWLKHFTPPEAVERWIGVDWNPRAEAQTVAGYDEVLHANMDAELPLSSQIADAVVSLHVFEHLPRPGSTLAEVSRLLRSGGIFLGGAPTMPGFLAYWRERYFRRRFLRGEVQPGGHITCLSPRRWRQIAGEVGLDVEFAVGSHAVRMTGGWLENFLPWVRLNQLWGALFPALGSECYLRARCQPAWDFQPVSLRGDRPRRRLLWASAAVGACALLVASAMHLSGFSWRDHCPVSDWLSIHQTGSDHFLVLADDDIPERVTQRADVTHVASIDHIADRFRKNQAAHILVEGSQIAALARSIVAQDLAIDSRLVLEDTDYFLLRHEDATESSFTHYLFGR
jgi:SAM-dependent methyltransferase